MNNPKRFPYHYLAVCINDDIPRDKHPDMWIEKGSVYRIYSFAHPLNSSEELSFYIEDSNGVKLEPFYGVPTFLSSRFSIIMHIWLN